MSHPKEAFTGNMLLSNMEADDLGLLKPHLTRVNLTPRQVLAAADQLIDHVYFLEDGIASIVSTLPDTAPTEIGIFGRDGMSGTAVLLGSGRSPYETYMQVDGTTALRIESERLLEATSQSPSLLAILLRYVQALLSQTSYSSVSNARHRVEARLARWLLMCHDRIDGDVIEITHEFMSMMIAAQRTGVTVTLHMLEGAGMIRSKRSRVTIIDREKLEDLAGDAYGRPEKEYRRLIGPIGRTADVVQFDEPRSLRAV